MLFVIHYVDKPNHAEVRAANRQAHLDHIGAKKDQVLVAGPTTSDDGAQMTGSVIIMDFTDRAEAEDFTANDPYVKAGLFERVEVKAWKKVLPAG
jgi:uncharacterized protein